MLIRRAHLTAMAEASEVNFHTEMENRIRAFAPRLANTAGPTGVQQFVRQGIPQARQYGFTGRDTIRFFLESACVLGHRFDTDPQYPWAAEVLRLDSLNSEDQRADLLARHLYDYMDAVVGEKNERAAAALRRLEGACPKRFEDLSAMDVSAVADHVMTTYPAKYSYVGRSRLTVLFEGAAQQARSAAPGLKAAETLTGVLVLAIGHGAFDDPLYPWIGGVFADRLLATSEDRFARLYDRARTWLKHVAQHLGEVDLDA